jgi:hypothetical protein
VVGVLVGYALRDGGTAFADQATAVRERAHRVRAELGVLTTEYPQGVDARGRGVGQTEYDGSARRVNEAVRALDEDAADLRALDPSAHERAQRLVRQLQEGVANRRPPREVLTLVDRSRAALDELTESASAPAAPTASPRR